MLGISFCNLLAGALSDVFGRKMLVLTMVVVHIISSFLTWLSPNFWVFLIGRMLVGGSIHSAWAGLFILLQETTPRQHRTITSGLMNFGKCQCVNAQFTKKTSFRLEHRIYVDFVSCLFHSWLEKSSTCFFNNVSSHDFFFLPPIRIPKMALGIRKVWRCKGNSKSYRQKKQNRLRHQRFWT